jgi:hypothetical protein
LQKFLRRFFQKAASFFALSMSSRVCALPVTTAEALQALLRPINKQVSATFCEQKVAKKLWSFGPVRFHRLRPSVVEVFAPLFSKSGLFLRCRSYH